MRLDDFLNEELKDPEFRQVYEETRAEEDAKLEESAGHRIVEMHCHNCDWHGFGEVGDACYDCGDPDSLLEWEPEDSSDAGPF